ncbi:MAG: hypothetical protein DMG10_31075, partial [Acidobacteria bacterium]
SVGGNELWTIRILDGDLQEAVSANGCQFVRQVKGEGTVHIKDELKAGRNLTDFLQKVYSLLDMGLPVMPRIEPVIGRVP